MLNTVQECNRRMISYSRLLQFFYWNLPQRLSVDALPRLTIERTLVDVSDTGVDCQAISDGLRLWWPFHCVHHRSAAELEVGVCRSCVWRHNGQRPRRIFARRSTAVIKLCVEVVSFVWGRRGQALLPRVFLTSSSIVNASWSWREYIDFVSLIQISMKHNSATKTYDSWKYMNGVNDYNYANLFWNSTQLPNHTQALEPFNLLLIDWLIDWSLTTTLLLTHTSFAFFNSFGFKFFISLLYSSLSVESATIYRSTLETVHRVTVNTQKMLTNAFKRKHRFIMLLIRPEESLN